MKTILVTGSSGTIGSRTVGSLPAQPGVRVRAAVHTRQAPRWRENVEVVHMDYDRPGTMRAAAADVDAVFMITPSVPNQVQLAGRLLHALAAARVPKLVRLSAMGAGARDGAIFVREHAEMEGQIVDSGIPYTMLRPNSYMSNFLTHYRPDHQGNIRLPLGSSGISAIDPRDVAEVAVRVLTTAGHNGKAYTLTGPRAITVSEIATAISEATGIDVTYIDAPEEATRQRMLAHGMLAIVVDGLLDLFATQKAGRMATVTDTVRELTGRQPRTFLEFARDHADGWRANELASA